MNQLTTIAALPGSGGGCMSALPVEKNEAKKLEHVICTNWVTLEAARGLYREPKVQMKAAYFEEPKEEPLPKIEPPPTIQELAQKYLDAHEGLGC